MPKNKNIVLATLVEHWKKFRAEIKTCKREFSAEAVHGLRVATRRLLAVMDILRILDPHPRVQKIRRVLKDQLDSLDELRDIQVMLVDVSKALVNFPDLKAFETHLLSREKKSLRKARKRIGGLPFSELRRRVEKCSTQLDESVNREDLTAQILSAVDQAYARALQAFGQIEASQPATIHHFRIMFKKFRYMVEVVSTALSGYSEVYFKQMHDYQSQMGDVQDIEVLLGALNEFDEQHDDKIVLISVRKWIEAHRVETIAGFMDGKQAILDFWRPSSKANFPWEQLS